MRTYPRNSPHAAARVVSLALLSDGNLCRVELDALERIGAHPQLGLQPAEFQGVIHEFCEDLLATAGPVWGTACAIDADTITGLLSEIDDPALQRKVAGLCRAAIDADGHRGEGEHFILDALARAWPQGAATTEPPCNR